jgi:chitinase
LALLIVVVLGVILASLRSWTWFQQSRELEAASGPGFAGYVDVTATPSLAFETPQNAASLDTVLAFVVADPDAPCQPSWGAAYSLDEASDALDLDRRIALLRERGGDVTISFGGQANTELAVGCTSGDQLLAAYEDVVKRYQAKTIDLDIEGTALDDREATQRRGAAIARLQHDTGVQVWVTVPVARSGLTASGTRFVAETLAAGVDLAGVNLMTMDYGDVPAGQTMGEAAVDALNAAHSQLSSIYSQHGKRLSAVDVWQHMGATAMLGQNDIAGEVFTLADAAQLRSFASAHKLGRLSMWSLNRDRSCGDNYPDVTIVSDGCSGVSQQPGDFAAALAGIDSSSAAASPVTAPHATGTPTTVPTIVPSDDPSTSPYQIWDAEQVYLEGTRVVWHHNVYQAKWWTSGDIPDDPQQTESPWTLLGPVLPGETPEPSPTLASGTYPAWRIGTVYHAGDRVLFENIAYEAQWWTQGDRPGVPGTASAPSPWRPLTETEVEQVRKDGPSASAAPPQQLP